MKFLDKLSLKIFSLIILVISIVLMLAMAKIIPLQYITDKIIFVTEGNSNVNITIAVLIICILLSLKGIFFASKKEDAGKDGIILENNSGKLVISKESLENLIAAVAKDIPGAETISSKTVLDKNKNLIVYVTTVVSKDVMLKDMSSDLQRRIKESLKRTADLEVKEVNIRIKNVTSKKVKGLPVPVEEKAEEENTKEEIKEETLNEKNEETGKE